MPINEPKGKERKRKSEKRVKSMNFDVAGDSSATKQKGGKSGGNIQGRCSHLKRGNIVVRSF